MRIKSWFKDADIEGAIVQREEGQQEIDVRHNPVRGSGADNMQRRVLDPPRFLRGLDRLHGQFKDLWGEHVGASQDGGDA